MQEQRSQRAGSTVQTPTAVWLQNLALTVPFILVFLVQLTHHQLWRDELNAFGIAESSPTLPALFHYIHYEGHPWLWYVLLWFVSRTTHLPLGMKILEGVIGTSIYLVLGLASPFTRIQKLLLFFCYYVSFEYTVMSRMYGVMLLLAFLYMRRRSLYPNRILGNAILLGLLASSDLTGFILAAALACEYAWTIYHHTQESTSAAPTKTNLFAAASIYLGFAGLAALSLWPAKDISIRTTGQVLTKVTSIRQLISVVVDYFAVAIFPTMTGSPEHFWNATYGSHKPLFRIAIVLVLAAYWRTFRGKKNLLILFWVTCFLAILEGHLIYVGSVRHFGITFVAFLLALWLMRSQGDRIEWPAYLLLIATAIGGIDAGFEQWRRPFSNAQNTAQWLNHNGLDQQPWVGTKDTSTIGVAELARHPLYMLECNCTDSFLLFSKRRDSYYLNELPGRLALAQKNLAVSHFIFINIVRLTDQEIQAITSRGLQVTSLKAFEGADVPEEDFYIYSIASPRI